MVEIELTEADVEMREFNSDILAVSHNQIDKSEWTFFMLEFHSLFSACSYENR